ncbi:MAG: 6,7-dimethyl-8-ribityllumazine synthase [Flavobacteriaceae bacterium TMED212]|nr:MAG: 6,7-dimethyl-8-ribityllumazine synthase [Flavobacteriaceae bacterium TMED212]|tara:strand:- start:3868 stop:4341 length:474 start_codon:yes stop_codon:yes gene_type:complete
MATFTNRLSHYDRSKVPDGKDYRIGLVVSKWNETITELLYKGAKDTLLNHNVAEKNIIRIDVPGSFELIYGASRAQQMSLDAIITIGCIIKGDTRHFEFISNAIAHGIKDLNLNGKAPVVFCVLTDDNIEQSKARSGGDKGNKGVEAAVTALSIITL